MSKDETKKQTPRITNKKARFQYEIIEKVEAGMVLRGSEVKSLRTGQASITEAFARIENGEVWLHGANIQPYAYANVLNHEPLRPRKLLLHKRQIARIVGQTATKGLTVIPLAIYFSKGRAKCEIALAKGKTHRDKRQDLKKRDHQREMARAMRARR